MAADQLSTTFAALADPTRRALPMSLQAVSKHLEVLERAVLITRGRVRAAGTFRPISEDERGASP